VGNGVQFLHAFVVAARYNLAVAHEYRADRDTALLPAHAGFGDGGLHEFVHEKGL
jgi:hypothetical protein